MNLSPHFSIEEMTLTTHREYLARNRAIGGREVEALTALCVTLLEPIRLHFGAPVFVHSGYRCPELNAAIHGSRTSQHMLGEAADIHVAGATLSDVWTWVWRDSGLPFGQAILEGHVAGDPSWLHISLGEPWRPRERSRQHFVVRDAP